jgi:CubicO group peptidase (beta-lactamase class C family)
MTPLLLTVALAATPDVAAFDAALDRAERTGGLHGEVLVLQGDRELYRRRLGQAPEDGAYRLGSITKSITAATVLSLVDEGRLELRTPIHELLPELTELADPPITVHQLLSHTSGLDGLDLAPWAREPSFDEWLTAVRNSEMLASRRPPGSEHRYSNGGYVLLTEVVRRLTDGSFEAAVNERVAQPLGLEGLYLHEGWRDVPGHLITPVGRLPARKVLPHLMVDDARWDLGGHGAWTATVDDLAAWGAAWRDGRLLTPELRGAATTPVADDYGYGWVIDETGVWHNGALSPLGIYAYVRWSPDDDLVVAWVNAVDVSSVQPEVRALADHLYTGEGPELRTQTGPMGWMALVSWLWLPWWLAAPLLLGWFAWARRPGRAKLAVAAGGMTVGGLLLGLLATSGWLGISAALMGTAAATAAPWRRAVPRRPKGWPLLAVMGALVLSAGIGWAGLVSFVYYLIADPWSFFAAMEP